MIKKYITNINEQKTLFLLFTLTIWTACDKRKNSFPPKTHTIQIESNRFKLLQKNNKLFLLDNNSLDKKVLPLKKKWFRPKEEEKERSDSYVTAFNYAKKVSSFAIDANKIGLHFSSYDVQKDGSAQYAAGKDIFIIYIPQTKQIYHSQIKPGISKGRARIGEFSALHHHFYIYDIDRDGSLDIGMVKEEIFWEECYKDDEYCGLSGPYYLITETQWYVFRENQWVVVAKRYPEPSENITKLPLIGMEKTSIELLKSTNPALEHMLKKNKVPKRKIKRLWNHTTY